MILSKRKANIKVEDGRITINVGFPEQLLNNEQSIRIKLQGTAKDAKKLCSGLGIEYITIEEI